MKSDIFFFITSISIIIFTIFLVIVGIYIVKIVKNFSHMSETLKNTVDDADVELREMSEHVRQSAIFNFIFGRKKSKGHSRKS